MRTVAAVLAVLALIFVLVGTTGVGLGPDADTGWWLDIVGIVLALAAFVVLRTRRNA